jgi:hypothetical protein
MRADRPLIGAIIFLGLGLGLIFAYCTGTTGFNAAYPLSGSSLHVEFTTIGPAAVGGLVATAVGLVLLIVAFFAGIVSLFSDPMRTIRTERVVERYPVGTPVVAPDGTTRYSDVPAAPVVVEERKHFWQRPSRTRL